MTESERNQRIHHHMYETCEGIQQQSERIVALEELVAELWEHVSKPDRLMWPELYERIEELEVPL